MPIKRGIVSFTQNPVLMINRYTTKPVEAAPGDITG